MLPFEPTIRMVFCATMVAPTGQFVRPQTGLFRPRPLRVTAKGSLRPQASQSKYAMISAILVICDKAVRMKPFVDATSSTTIEFGRGVCDAEAEPSVSSSYFRVVTDFCDDHGLSSATLLQAANLNPQVVEQVDSRISGSHFLRTCELAARHFNLAHIGVEFGQRMKPAYLGAYGYALLSCRTLSEAAIQFQRFSTLATDLGHNTWEYAEGSPLVITWHSHLAASYSANRFISDLIAASWLTMSRLLTGRADIGPIWVAFPYSEPEDPAPYRKFFRSSLRFDAPRLAAAFDSQLFDLPLVNGDPEVHATIRALCERLLQRLVRAREPDWIGACRRAIVRSLPQEVPSMEEVALELAITPVMLRQRLAERSISFQQLVDSLRRDLALAYLADRTLSLVDIALLLGFSEQSAFQRAFKRWTGETPGDYRRRSPRPTH